LFGKLYYIIFAGDTENEVYFGFTDPTNTIRLGTVPDFYSETSLKVQAKIDANEELKAQDTEPENFVETHIIE
jgi:hypothetical protein